MERFANYILQLYPIDHVPFKRRVMLHGVFWGIFFCFLLIVSGLPSDTIAYRFIGATSYILTSSAFFYVFAYLIPHLYSKYTGVVRILFIGLTIIIFLFFMAFETHGRVILVIENHWVTAQYKSKRIYEIYYNVYKSSFWTYFAIDNIVTDLIQLLFTSLPVFFLKFTRVFAKNLSEKKQLEIDFLRLQINPHFLVNTLTNIYGLVIVQDQRSPEAVKALSNLLSYVLYESSMPTVSVEREIQFLQDFVALEQIKNSSKIRVEMTIEGEPKGNIAPLILIAFIENAFKHGMGDSKTQSYIHIHIKVENNTFSLKVENGKVPKTLENQKKSLGGIGLVNVQKRLNSLYPNRHSLQIIPEPLRHQISLTIVLT